MFNLETFIEECRQAGQENKSQVAVRDVVERAIASPEEIVEVLGEPKEAGFKPLYHSEELTILNFTWAPLMSLMPHNHNMWAVIGIYIGREDNIFWRKTDDGIEAVGAKSLMPGGVATLGSDIIHSVLNPLDKMTSAIHVYGGDFFAPGRSEWNPETLTESDFDFDKSRRIFRQANERFNLTS